jgi:hypothetical protein
MPPNAAHAPRCFLCERRNSLPPSKLGWIKAAEGDGLFVICADCGWERTDSEIEAAISAKLSEPVAVAAE